MSNPTQAKVFISHRSCDKSVATALCDLIQSSYRLQSSEIVCTSADAHGVENGKPSYFELKKQLQSAAIVIYLISESFCQSEDCLYEIAWGFDLNSAFYFHLDGVTSLAKPHCVAHLSMNNFDHTGLTELKLRFNQALKEREDVRIWNKKSIDVLAVFQLRTSLLSEVQDKKTVSRGALKRDKDRQELDDYIKKCSQSICVNVYDKFDEFDDTIAKIGVWTFLAKMKAKQLVEERKCNVVDFNVVALCMLKDIQMPNHGIHLKCGAVYPIPGHVADDFIKNKVGVWVNSASDVDAVRTEYKEIH